MMAFPVLTICKVTYNSIELSWDETNNNDKKKNVYHIQLSKARSRSPSPGAPALDPLTNYQGFGQHHVFKGLEPQTEYLCRARFVEEGLGHGSARWSQPKHVTTAKEPPSGAELHRAVGNRDIEQVKKILGENNSVVEVMDKHGLTPLMSAAQKDFLDVMETLLELGADPNYMNSSGKTCMMIACYAGKEEPVKLLRERGVSWDARDRNGLTAVHWAAEGGHDDLLLDMIRDGAPVDVECTANGWTPLMRVACVNGNYDVGEVLIAKGADVNKTDKSGKTILMAASMNGHFDLVRLLVEKGADVMCKNREGKTALEFAQSFERHRIIKFLEFQNQKEEKQRKAKLLEEKQRQIREQSKIQLGNAKA